MICNAVEVLDYMMRDDPGMRRMIERGIVEALLGQAVYDARERAGMSREDLAKHVGVTADDIEDIEEGDYEGDVLILFAGIAKALGLRIAISLKPEDQS
jgi:ribosome-binding protein aMBF1 (putative translation factor)